MQVADRTDLLALNAALEGTKAGEAGKGFILVAAEMRRLAENVMESVANIRKLMQDVKTSSGSAVEASQGGTQLSEETTRSARDIALVTQQQRQATEQVTRSMDEMASVLGNTVSGVKHVTASATALAELAARLSSVIATSGASARPASAELDGSPVGDVSGRR
jgi:methyl-accepting chemotaxis protein